MQLYNGQKRYFAGRLKNLMAEYNGVVRGWSPYFSMYTSGTITNKKVKNWVEDTFVWRNK